MEKLQHQQQKVGEQIFNEVIEKKHITKISTKQICKDIKIEDEEIKDYLLGKSKNNLPLGIIILDYLEEQEKQNNPVNNGSKGE